MRPKTFNGCLSCRQRRVRCTEEKPACSRCVESGIDCLGYEINLFWPKIHDRKQLFGNSHRSSRGESIKRRSIKFVKGLKEYVTQEQLADDLMALDCIGGVDDKVLLNRMKEQDTTYTKGPFGVFVLNSSNESRSAHLGRGIATNHSPMGKEKDHLVITEIERLEPHTDPFDFELGLEIFNTLKKTLNFQDYTNLNDSDELGWDFNTLKERNDHMDYNTNSHIFQSMITQGMLENTFHIPKDVMERLEKDDPLLSFICEMHSNTMGDFELSDKDSIESNKATSALIQSALLTFLLKHYTSSLSKKMTAIENNVNPWKTIFLPMSLVGGILFETSPSSPHGYSYTSDQVPNSKNSILNALFAASCFHLQEQYNKGTEPMVFFLNLGIEFRSRATHYLEKLITEYDQLNYNDDNDDRYYKGIICALLSMNTIDVVWGTMADCHYHLKLCGDVIETRFKNAEKPLSKNALVLNRIYSFIGYIHMSTSYSSLEFDPSFDFFHSEQVMRLSKECEGTHDFLCKETLGENGVFDSIVSSDSPYNQHDPEFLVDHDFSDQNPNWTIEMMYGIPNSLIHLFHGVIKSYKVKRLVKSSLKNMEIHALNTISFLDRGAEHLYETYEHLKQLKRKSIENILIMEESLITWRMEWRLTKSKEIDDHGAHDSEFISKLHEGLYHYIMSFYYGVLIYHYTMCHSLDISDERIKEYCQNTFKHLSKLTKVIHTNIVKIIPLIWPAFIASCATCDENLQSEFKKWFGELKNIGLGSYSAVQQVIYEVWKRRKNNESNDDWFNVQKDWELNLMLS